MKKIFFFLILSGAVFLDYFFFASIIDAKQIIFSDDFDDGRFSDWTVQRNIGDNNWKVCLDTAAPAKWAIREGRLGMVIDGTTCVTEIIPNNLDLTNVDNFEFEFDWSLDESTQMDRGVVFLWQDKNNWYNVYLFGPKIMVQKLVAGVVYQVTGGSGVYQFTANQVYHFKITVTADHKIKVFINDQLIIDAQDQAPFLSGFKSLGLQAGSSLAKRSVSYFDNLFVYSLDNISDTILDVTLFKQNNPLWAGEIYDTAEKWSKKPTLARWGCALSSMAMILEYYNIKNLPGEIPITPGSLNNWLKQQPDGYIGDGLLNWLAVTRLTKLISDQKGTPKLEYLRQSGHSLTPTLKAIDQNQPTILQTTGHFLVAAGYNSDKSDLIIKDPIYNYSRWSQHQTELISTRLFKPSFTDLSYILVLSEPEIELNIRNSEGKPVENVQVFTEQIIADDTGEINPNFAPEKTKKYQIHQISKPVSAIYNLEITAPEYQKFSLETYAYTKNGQVNKFVYTGYAQPEPIILNLDYKKEVDAANSENSESTLERIVTWQTIENDLANLRFNNLIEKSYIYHKLSQIAGWGEQTPLPKNKKRYLDLFTNYLTSYANLDLKPSVKDFLNSDLNFLKESI